MSFLRPIKNPKMVNDMRNLGKIIIKYNKNQDDDYFLEELTNFLNTVIIEPKYYAKNVKNEIGMPYGNITVKAERIVDTNNPVDLILHEMDRIPEIQNKNILENPKFIDLFYNIFWSFLMGIGFSTINLYDYIDKYIYNMNRITRDKYVIYDCRSTDLYNCGRAMLVIPRPDLFHPSKIVVFNTGADEDVMDQGVIDYYLGININFEETPIDINLIKRKYPRYGNRIYKELTRMNDYDIQIIETGLSDAPLKVGFRHKNKDITSFLSLPSDYPHKNPFGTYNGMSISDVDVNISCTGESDKGWNPKCNLSTLLNYLENKYMIKVPTKESAFKLNQTKK